MFECLLDRIFESIFFGGIPALMSVVLYTDGVVHVAFFVNSSITCRSSAVIHMPFKCTEYPGGGVCRHTLLFFTV